MSRAKGRVRSSQNSPSVRLSKESTQKTVLNILAQHEPRYDELLGTKCVCLWKGEGSYEEHLADVFTQLGFRKLSMVEIMDLTEPERMNAARGKVEARGKEAREILKKEAVLAELSALTDDMFSWADGPLMCLDKCGDPKCRDDIRIGAMEDIADWIKQRKEGIQNELDTLKANAEEE